VKPQYRILLISGALVFLASALFYFVLFSTAVHLEGDNYAMVDLTSAAIRALILTAGFVIAYLFVRWLHEHAVHHRRAANGAIVLMFALVMMILVQYLTVPSQLESPLIPSWVIAYARRPLLIEGFGLLVALGLGIRYRRSGRMVSCVICGAAAVAFDFLFSPMWSLVMHFIQEA